MSGLLTEADLRAKTVKELKDICKEAGVPASGKKDELIAALLEAHQAHGSAGGGALEELEDAAGVGAHHQAEAGGGTAAGPGAAADAAPGKHAAIVFRVEEKKEEAEKKANIVGVATLSTTERAQLRASKFGGAAAAKPDAGGVSVPGAPRTLEEQIKVLERGLKYGKASEGDAKKLEDLRKKLEVQKEKQRLALDKVELADPAKMAAREKKFGKPLIASKDPKDPEALKKRAAKFGKAPAAAPPASKAEDDARKKARLERFAKGNE